MDSSQDGMVTLRGTDQVLGELDSSRTADSLAEVTNITNDESASVYELRVEDRTGDTTQSARRRQRHDPPHILLTTPESLALLLSYEDAPRIFEGLERVVVDPARNFGRPTDNDTGVPTDVLAAALVAEGGDAARVARWWGVPVEAVEQAAEFEVRFGLRHAA